ncbi:hypothetical protein B484DRAFT_96591 [Ochromonadaceae sp. CCMP2298]|nr:hypothetical protein B484DRAFT_96591 [Ochromonadaceae sp. CCMP2298]
MSYNAWALSNYQVSLKCPTHDTAYLAECVPHTLKSDSVQDLFILLGRLMGISPDPSLLYLRIGSLHGDLSREQFSQPVSFLSTSNSTSTTPSPTSTSTFTSDIVQSLDRTLLHNSSWSVRVYDYRASRAQMSAALLGNAGITVDPEEEGKGKGKNGKKVRSVGVRARHLCAGLVQVGVLNGTRMGGDRALGGCVSLLGDVKGEGGAHWDAQVIVIDANPPYGIGGEGGGGGGVVGRRRISTGTSDTSSTPNDRSSRRQKHTSLGVLLNLDLVFMRPKVIFLRIAATGNLVQRDVTEAHRHLRQSGFLTSSYTGPECGASRRRGEGAVAATYEYVCVWGVRVNEFEFFPNMLY